MKKISIIIFSICMATLFANFVLADGLEKSGDYSVYRRNGEIVSNAFVEEGKRIYYCTENGSIAVNSWIYEGDEKYYASNDGTLYTNTVETIDGKGYVFDRYGKVKIGWINGEYYANLEGALVTGFQQLVQYDGTIEDEDENSVSPSGKEKKESDDAEVSWYYFQETGVNKYKKCFSEEGPYVAKTINNRKYCFDEEGKMCTGWRMIKEKTPIISGYMFFSEDDTEEFEYGQAITTTWYATPGPDDDDMQGETDVRYYYFLSTGFPICAKEGSKLKQRIGEKYYLFNDQGFVEYGIKNVSGDYYYFGTSVADSSMKTGKVEIDNGSNSIFTYYFEEESGKGYTGVHGGKLYYKGRLQCAEEDSRCVGIKVAGTTRLVNESGTVLKNKKNHRDGDGNTWSSNSSGVVTSTDGGIVLEATEPEETGN